MKDEIILKLEPLLNKQIWYNNQETIITRYEMNDERERVIIHFNNRGKLDRPYESAYALIDQFSPIPTIPDKPEVTAIQVPGGAPVSMPFLGDTGVLDKATSILLEDIEAIKSGELDLDKAEARASNVDKIIEIEKTKVAKAAVVAKFLGK